MADIHDPRLVAAQRGSGLTARPFDAPAFERAIADLLRACGVDGDPQVQGTPARVKRLWQERLLAGQPMDLAQVLSGFEDPARGIVAVRQIPVQGLCPHHLVPFLGLAHVAYLPGGRLFGFGNLRDLVDATARRFTFQEWLSADIATAIVVHGGARAATCVVEAQQLCLLLEQGGGHQERVITEAHAGAWADDVAAQRHAVALLRESSRPADPAPS